MKHQVSGMIQRRFSLHIMKMMMIMIMHSDTYAKKTNGATNDTDKLKQTRGDNNARERERQRKQER